MSPTCAGSLTDSAGGKQQGRDEAQAQRCPWTQQTAPRQQSLTVRVRGSEPRFPQRQVVGKRKGWKGGLWVKRDLNISI